MYRHEKCGTNPSRHLPEPKTPVTKIKNVDFGVSGVSGDGLEDKKGFVVGYRAALPIRLRAPCMSLSLSLHLLFEGGVLLGTHRCAVSPTGPEYHGLLP